MTPIPPQPQAATTVVSVAASRLELLKTVITSFEAQYKDLSETWRHLDTKAQGTTTVNGVFLAAMIALVKDAPGSLTPAGVWLAIGIVGLLIVSVIFSLLALRVTAVAPAPEGEERRDLVGDVLRIQDDRAFEESLPDFYRDTAAMWRDTNDDVAAANARKARWLNVSQWALFVAVVGAGLFLVLLVV